MNRATQHMEQTKACTTPDRSHKWQTQTMIRWFNQLRVMFATTRYKTCRTNLTLIMSNWRLVHTLLSKIQIRRIFKRIWQLRMLKMRKKLSLSLRLYSMRRLKARVKMNSVLVPLNQLLIPSPTKRRIQKLMSQVFKNINVLKDREERRENTLKRWSKRRSNIDKIEKTFVKSTDSNLKVSNNMMSIRKTCLTSRIQKENRLFLTLKKIKKVIRLNSILYAMIIWLIRQRDWLITQMNSLVGRRKISIRRNWRRKTLHKILRISKIWTI